MLIGLDSRTTHMDKSNAGYHTPKYLLRVAPFFCRKPKSATNSTLTISTPRMSTLTMIGKAPCRRSMSKAASTMIMFLAEGTVRNALWTAGRDSSNDDKGSNRLGAALGRGLCRRAVGFALFIKCLHRCGAETSPGGGVESEWVLLVEKLDIQ